MDEDEDEVDQDDGDDGIECERHRRAELFDYDYP